MLLKKQTSTISKCIPELKLKRTDNAEDIIHHDKLDDKKQENKSIHFKGLRKPIQFYIQEKKKRLQDQGLEYLPRQKKESVLTGPPNYKITNIQYPEKIENLHKKKKYQISFSYIKDDKKHHKTLRFGKKNVLDFIDDNSMITRGKVMKSLRNYESPFQPNFWRYKLLNQGGALKDNYINLISELIV